MIWIAPSEKDTASASLEKRLWDAADQFRANSGLKAQEYSGPILGLIFLRFAEVRFTAQREKLEKAGSTSRRGSRVDEPTAYHADNANYLWIQLFYSDLSARGRAGFVMANSASDARSSEQELRQKLIEARAVDAMVAVGPNMFYTVTLPCTLWLFDKGKVNTPRSDTVLFIDARHIYRQVDRAHRDWTPAQISFMANIVRLYRGEPPDLTVGGEETETKLREVFGRNFVYADVPGLCKAATLEELEAQGWSLNPGRYVGVAPGEEISDEDFKTQLETLHEELETLNAQARELETTIAANVAEILEA